MVKSKLSEEGKLKLKIQEINNVISKVINIYSNSIDECGLLLSSVNSFYIELDKLCKKAPVETITDLQLKKINRTIDDTKILIKNDRYISDIEKFEPAGDLPQNRDALYILAELQAGLNRFKLNIEKKSNELEYIQCLTELKLLIDGIKFYLDKEDEPKVENLSGFKIIRELSQNIEKQIKTFIINVWFVKKTYKTYDSDKTLNIEKILKTDFEKYINARYDFMKN